MSKSGFRARERAKRAKSLDKVVKTKTAPKKVKAPAKKAPAKPRRAAPKKKAVKAE